MYGTGQQAFAAQELRRDKTPRAATSDLSGSGWSRVRIRSMKHPFGKIGYKHTASGRVVKGERQDLGGGIYRFRNPEARHLVTPFMGGDKVRRKRHRKAAWSLATGPGVLGLVSGNLIPRFASVAASGAFAGATAVAGYLAPSGSFFRRFSVGAGIGGGLYAAERAVDELGGVKETISKFKTVVETVVDVYRDPGKALFEHGSRRSSGSQRVPLWHQAGRATAEWLFSQQEGRKKVDDEGPFGDPYKKNKKDGAFGPGY